MVRESEIREGELAVDMPAPRDAGLVFIGRIRTPWTSRLETPRQGRHDGPVCRLEIFEPWVPAIKGVDFYSNLEVIYWLHQSRRDLVLQSPKNNENDARHVLAALAGAAQSDRHLDRQAGRHRRQRRAGARPRLPRRDAAARPQARPLRVHAAGAAAGRAISRRSSCHPAARAAQSRRGRPNDDTRLMRE